MSKRFLLALLPLLGTSLLADTSITSNGVTWEFSADHQTGTYVNGDPWVIGPVTVVSITNTLNSPKFTPRPGQNGSMLNPGTDGRQGYDETLKNYDASLNVALRGGSPVSAAHPLSLPVNSTLISAVSWLYHSETDTEPGTPKFNGGTKTPRPALRSAGLLTVVDKAPPSQSFRPPYVGTDKTARFQTGMLDYSKLPVLKPAPASAPSIDSLAKQLSRTWIDHVNDFMGGFTHPSEHMPNYGRDMARIIAEATLVLFTDDSPRGKNPAKDQLVIGLVQYGIDLTGIADNGGGWPANGGHCMGRKWPILFAGTLLNDAQMKDAGQWKTRFQEDEQTFYVTAESVSMTAGPTWNPDKRAPRVPYTQSDIGTAEWGINHAFNPAADNGAWEATYREINGAVIPSFALAARLMNLKQAWNHDAFFDYCDRYMKWKDTQKPTANQVTPFMQAMWNAHRASAR
jgi:hypothetical protein